MKEQNIQLSLVFAIRRFLINVRYPGIMIRRKESILLWGKMSFMEKKIQLSIFTQEAL